MKLVTILASAAALAFTSTAASAITIDFNDLSGDVNYSTLTYENTTFSASSGLITAAGRNGEMRLCANDRPWGCIADLTIVFDAAVENLTFDLSGVNDAGLVAIAEVSLASGMTQFVDLFGSEILNNPQDLSALGPITSLVLRSDDTLGLSYDNFSFDVAAVPEPAAFGSMLLGLGLVGAALRRRRQA